MRLYLVIGQNDYDPELRWLVAAFSTPEDAETHCGKCNKWVNDHLEDAENGLPTFAGEANPHDPTTYHLEAEYPVYSTDIVEYYG